MEEYIYHYNLIASLVAATVPFIIGLIWYHPNFIFKKWTDSVRSKIILLKKNKAGLTFGFGFLLSFIFAYSLDAIIEFSHYHPELPEPSHSDHTFLHGVRHAFIFATVFVATPTLLINAVVKYFDWIPLFFSILYFMLSIMIMGGIVDAWN